MSRPGERPDPDGIGSCGCDPEQIFELADGPGDGGISDPERAREVRSHLALCPGCRELYERELDLNAYLSSLNLPGDRPPDSSGCSVHRGVAMALPTRSLISRALWALLSGALLITAFVSLEANSADPVILATSVLAVCWGFVAGSAGVAHAVFHAAGPPVLLSLCIGALVDVVVVFVVFSISRGRRAREV